MPVETLQRPVRTPARSAVPAAPPRLRPKGTVGRQCPAPEARPKQSAVERLEADKAKYVKSPVALSKQQPVKPPELRRPQPSPGSALRPTRKTPTQAKARQEVVQLNLEHLSNLISGVNDEPMSSATASSEDSGAPGCAGSPCTTAAETQQKKERPVPPPRPDWSSPAKVRLKASGPVKVETLGSPGSPAAGTVRRVDVMPQASPVRTPCRPPQFMLQPLQPLPIHPQFPLRQAVSNLRLFHRRTPASSPLKPVVAKPDNPPSSPAGTPVSAPSPQSFNPFPPSSPAITRLSSSSSRKRPSLTRSKSDMSDRFSRAGTELERFFNLCGLDPSDLPDLPGSSSDIVSLARFRSVSAPASECAGSGGEEGDGDGEDAGNMAERVPYGVSVIERNARVIKWLFGLRQAKDNVSKSTNL